MPFFIEVGTCDFDTLDKLATNGWKGIMVEPITEYIDKLPKHDNIHYENIAISNVKGNVDVHYIDPDKIKHEDDEWMKGISSINGASGPLNFNKHIERFRDCKKVNVETLTLNELCEKYNVTEIDLLKIDTEGHEYYVLKGASKNLSKINYIYFEHHYDDMLKKGYTFSDIHNFLKKNNFKMILKSKMFFRKTFEYIYQKV